MRSLTTNSVPFRIFWITITFSMLSLASLVGLLVFTAGIGNDMARENTSKLIQTTLNGRRETLAFLVGDYRNWDAAYQWFVAGDAGPLYDNIGIGAADSASFDFLYLLNPDGTPSHAYANDIYESDLALYQPALAQKLVSQIAAMPLEPYDTITGFAQSDGQIAIVGIGRVQPFEIGDLTPETTPLMVGGVWLSEETLTQIGEQLLINDFNLLRPGVGIPADFAAVPLLDDDDSLVGHFVWRPTRPGTQLLRHVAPAIVLLAGLLIAGSWLSARVAVHQTSAYLREKANARTDSLTGVLNRAGLEEYVRTPKFATLIKENKIALIFIDLNNFKTLNDERGHKAGDLALQVTAKRLLKSLRATDLLARLGGDEFVCLITDTDPLTAAKIATNRITFKTSQPIFDGQVKMCARVSMGVAISHAGLTWDTLLLHADAAMYEAKRSKLRHAAFYSDALSQAS